MPEIHPCRKRFSEVQPETYMEDLAQAVNTFQRHFQHTPTCLRKMRGGGNQPRCRFSYPFPLLAASELKRHDKGRLKFIPARNDEIVCKYNPFVTAVSHTYRGHGHHRFKGRSRCTSKERGTITHDVNHWAAGLLSARSHPYRTRMATVQCFARVHYYRWRRRMAPSGGDARRFARQFAIDE